MTDCDGKPLPSAPRCGRDLGFPLFLFVAPLVYWPLRCTTRAHVCLAAPWIPTPGNLCSPHPARTIGQILDGIERRGDCLGASQDCDGEAMVRFSSRPAWCHHEEHSILFRRGGGFLYSPFPRRCDDMARWCYGIGNFPLGVCAPWYVPAILAA